MVKTADELDGSEPAEEAFPVLVEAQGGRLYSLASRVCQRFHRKKSGEPGRLESLEELPPWRPKHFINGPGPGAPCDGRRSPVGNSAQGPDFGNRRRRAVSKGIAKPHGTNRISPMQPSTHRIEYEMLVRMVSR